MKFYHKDGRVLEVKERTKRQKKRLIEIRTEKQENQERILSQPLDT